MFERGFDSMPEREASEDAVYLGIDGGGTKCSAVLMTGERQVLGSGIAGPANPFQGFGQSIESIEAATFAALEDAGQGREMLRHVVAGVGLAGVNLPRVHESVSEWSHPFGHMFLTTDLEIACYGAHGGRDGAVIVAGTGSSGCSMTDGKTTIVGAHGFPFGDTGSGAWIGLEAVRAVLLQVDGLGPRTTLSERLSRALNANGVSIVERMMGARPREFASLAGLVFAAADAGDDVATDITSRGCSYLNDVARQLLATDPPAISLLGGLRDLVLPRLDEDIAARMSPPEHAPDVGAIIYAQRKHQDLLEAA